MSKLIYPKYRGGDINTGGYFYALCDAGMFFGKSIPTNVGEFSPEYPFQPKRDMFFRKELSGGEYVDWDGDPGDEFQIQVAISGITWLTTSGWHQGSGFRVYVDYNQSNYPWIVPDRGQFPFKITFNARGRYYAGTGDPPWSEPWAGVRVLCLPVLPEENLLISHINNAIRPHVLRGGNPSHDHSLGSLSTKDEFDDGEFFVDNKINPYSPFRPSGTSYHDVSEWRNYCPYAQGGVNVEVSVFQDDGQYHNVSPLELDDGEVATVHVTGNRMWEEKYNWSQFRLAIYLYSGTELDNSSDFNYSGGNNWEGFEKEFPYIAGFEGQTITYKVGVTYYVNSAWVVDMSSMKEFQIKYLPTPVKVQVKDADGNTTWPRRENATGAWVEIKFMLKNQTGAAQAFDCEFRTYNTNGDWVTKALTTDVVLDGQQVEVTIRDDTAGYTWDATRSDGNIWELHVKHPDDNWYLKGFASAFFTETGGVPTP